MSGELTARNDTLCLEPFDELRVNSVRGLSLVVFSKDLTKATKGRVGWPIAPTNCSYWFVRFAVNKIKTAQARVAAEQASTFGWERLHRRVGAHDRYEGIRCRL